MNRQGWSGKAPEGLVEIGDNVVDVLEPQGDTDQVRRDPGGLLFLLAELAGSCFSVVF